METYTQHAHDHVRYLSETIGGRGSCTAEVRKAAEYVYNLLGKYGAQQVRYEEFSGAPSTYRPYTLAFAVALIGALLALAVGNRAALAVAAVLNLLGAWAMYAETDFLDHWARWLSPKAATQNVVGLIPCQGEPIHKVVLCAHLDTHRTPVFYSSNTWHKIFGFLVSATFASMALGALGFGLGAIMNWEWLRWAAVLAAAIQIFALSLMIHADFTPFSPGANDNASAVGVVLGLAERLAVEPLAHTEVHLLFTDCEETACYGMIAYLERHAAELGPQAVYLVLDEVGLGHVKYITADGLIRKHPTHPKALALARQAASGLERKALELVGTAYCDALPATKRGLIALTVASVVPSHTMTSLHWHQMSDRLEYVDSQSLGDAHRFIWNILQNVDAGRE